MSCTDEQRNVGQTTGRGVRFADDGEYQAAIFTVADGIQRASMVS